MEKNQIIFEEVESRISELLERLSPNERKRNVKLNKVERRILRIMKRLRRVVNVSQFTVQEANGGLNAHI